MVHLTVSSRGQSHSKTVTVTVDNTFRVPATIKFAHVKDVLQNGSTCTTCHLPTAVVQPSATPPIWFTNFDRNFSGGSADATDDDWFYSEILGRVNLTEIGSSPLLRKPSDPVGGNHHNGGNLFDLASSGGLSNFSIIYNWILNGAPTGGVAANAGADSTNNLTFSGSPATDIVALNGNASIGATGFFLDDRFRYADRASEWHPADRYRAFDYQSDRGHRHAQRFRHRHVRREVDGQQRHRYRLRRSYYYGDRVHCGCLRISERNTTTHILGSRPDGNRESQFVWNNRVSASLFMALR